VHVIDPATWWAPRFRGQPGRLEVWYATCTDRATGAGLWVHGETVSPSDGGPPFSHGWVASFPPDGPPRWERTPVVTEPPGVRDRSALGFDAGGLRISPEGTSGSCGPIVWDLQWDAVGQRGLATFPLWAWEREALPAAQVVPAPDLRASGSISHDGVERPVVGHAQAARIYGHGNARRWGWLHADLGDGDLIEVVSAVSTRPGLRAAPPVTFCKLRVGGVDWPSVPVAPFGLRARLELPVWTVRGRVRGTSIDLRVEQPPERCVAIPYADPDGDTATCTNTERANLRLRVRTRGGVEREWQLDGTAHAEIGTRP
jgi:hypothetical protein